MDLSHQLSDRHSLSLDEVNEMAPDLIESAKAGDVVAAQFLLWLAAIYLERAGNVPPMIAGYLAACLRGIADGTAPAQALNLVQRGRTPEYMRDNLVAVDYVRLRDSQKEKHAVALKLIGEEWGLTESTVKRICTRERCKGARQYLAWQENEAGPHMQETIQEIRDRLKAGERAV